MIKNLESIKQILEPEECGEPWKWYSHGSPICRLLYERELAEKQVRAEWQRNQKEKSDS